MAFCPKCGKDIAPGRTFCDEHTTVSLDFSPFTMTICNCERVKVHDRWFIPQDLESSLLKAAKEQTKQKVTYSIDKLEVPEKKGDDGSCEISTTYQGELFTFTVPIRNRKCEKCARMGTHYFTAKLQLRNPPADVITFIDAFLAPLAEKGVAINNVEDTPKGPDLYMTHKSAARQLGEKLVRKYGGIMKSSEQLFSRNKQTSKNLYRLNVLVQFPSFSLHDVVVIDKKAVLVTGLGKQCTGRDLSLNKKVIFTAGDEEEVLKKHKTSIIAVHPEVMVMHPLTFQEVCPSNHDSLLSELKNGQKVKAVVMGKRVYIL